MNEVEKMYRNANLISYYCGDGYIFDAMLEVECTDGDKEKCKTCDKAKINYPPFTAEKQLELIKWLSTKELKIRTNKQPYAIYIGILGNDNTCFFGCEGLYFEQTLAEVINNLWQLLIEKERKQIKEILE